MTRTVTETDLSRFIFYAQLATDEGYSKFMPNRMDMAPKLQYDNITGRTKYARIFTATGSQRMCWGFINLENGDVLKAEGWKKPALNFARGNIFDNAHGTERVKWTGVG